MPDFKSIRMSSERRNRIIQHAQRVIVCTEEQETEARAHDTVLDLIQRTLPKFFSPADQKVLEHFDLLKRVDSVEIVHESLPGGLSGKGVKFPVSCRDVLADGDVVEMDAGARAWFREEVQNPAGPSFLVPYSWHRDSQHNGACARLPAKFSGVLLSSVDIWRVAVKAHDKARKTILKEIGAVVKHANTLEQVVDAWPPAAALYEQMGGLPDVDESVKARLRAAGVRE